ncbi:MAG TPA: serine hydrolase, partial [Chloroflexota bacterium]|nr:serine hydrolase [Chloroflexota bacterium]
PSFAQPTPPVAAGGSIAGVRANADNSGAAPNGTDAGQQLQMAAVAAPEAGSANATAAAAAGPGARPTPDAAHLQTARQWDVAAAGVISDAALVSRLDQALSGVDGRVSLMVKDLGSGHGAILDADRELPAASLYKLPVLYTVFDAGLGLAEALPITEEARSYDAGTMELGVGETLTVAEAVERMITLSDNTSAVMLGSRVGGMRINATLAALGMDATHYSLDRMTTSAADMVHLLELMARGKAVSPAASADMVHLLLRQRVNDRLPRLLPGEVQVAHKTGNLPGTVNDVGLLYGPSSTLAIAALVSDTTDESAAATAIARAAQVASTYFQARVEDPSRPTIPRAPGRSIPPVWREPRPVPTVTPTVEPSLVPVEGETTPPATTAAEAAVAATAKPTTLPTPPPTPTTPPVAATPVLVPVPAPPAVSNQAPPTATTGPAVAPTATSAPPPATRQPAPRPATATVPTAVPTVAGRR